MCSSASPTCPKHCCFLVEQRDSSSCPGVGIETCRGPLPRFTSQVALGLLTNCSTRSALTLVRDSFSCTARLSACALSEKTYRRCILELQHPNGQLETMAFHRLTDRDFAMTWSKQTAISNGAGLKHCFWHWVRFEPKGLVLLLVLF